QECRRAKLLGALTARAQKRSVEDGEACCHLLRFKYERACRRKPTRRNAVAFRAAARRPPRADAAHARRGAAAFVPLLPRAARRRRRPLRRVLVEALADRAALLCAARHSVHL